MLVKYRCPGCGHDKARFFTVERRDTQQTLVQIDDEMNLDLSPSFDIHLKCLKCGAETILENAYIEKMELNKDESCVDEGDIEIESLESRDNEYELRS